ncbi:hypothetical protein T484DRAFT_3633350, partial [Baffinella frigidus]
MMRDELAGAPLIQVRAAVRHGRTPESYGDAMQHMLSRAIASRSCSPSRKTPNAEDASAARSAGTPQSRPASAVDQSSFAARAASPQHRCPPQLQPRQGVSSAPTPTPKSPSTVSPTRAFLLAFGSSPRASQSSNTTSPPRSVQLLFNTHLAILVEHRAIAHARVPLLSNARAPIPDQRVAHTRVHILTNPLAAIPDQRVARSRAPILATSVLLQLIARARGARWDKLVAGTLAHARVPTLAHA